MIRNFRSTRGFTMVEIVMALGISAVVLLVVVSIMSQLFEEKKRADFLNSISDLRITFQRATIDSTSWENTKLNNTEMSCFAGPSSSNCTSLSGKGAQDFKLYSGSELLYDSTNAQLGYTIQGQPCSNYGTSGAGGVSTAASTCILKPHMKFQAFCNSSADPDCLAPLIIIELSYESSGLDIKGVNLSSYGFQLSKSTFSISSKVSCTGAIPTCTSTQAAICESTGWNCREFGL